MTNYLCKFDEKGYRHETHLACEYTDRQKNQMIADGYEIVNEADWQKYCEDGGNAYIRGADGKPTPAPPHMPTKDEKLAQLEAEYEANKKELKGYLMDAILSDNDDTIAELKEEMAEIEAQFQFDRKELEDE